MVLCQHRGRPHARTQGRGLSKDVPSRQVSNADLFSKAHFEHLTLAAHAKKGSGAALSTAPGVTSRRGVLRLCGRAQVRETPEIGPWRWARLRATPPSK